jgi:UDP-N-acetyl-2-amino-2-deoxyglucuronate dehydrogenase
VADSEPLGIALIGCGWAGSRHARAFAAAGGELLWAIDADVDRAESIAHAHPGCRAATSHQEALDDARVEAVDICLPHHLHAGVAIAAAESGVDVLVEKPLAATLEEADAMIAAAERAGVTLMVAENVRFTPVFLTVQELIQSGAIGEPALAQLTRQAYLRESFLRERPWFLNARAAAGGIMMSGGVHDFETLRMLLGDAQTVYASRARQRFLEMEGDDTSVAQVRYRSGAVATLVESFIMKSLTTAAGPEVHTLRVDGDDGSIEVRQAGGGVQTVRLFSERNEHSVAGSAAQHEILVPEADTFLAEIEHFITCVRRGDVPITDGRSQRVPLELVLAAYRSMETGLPVQVG